MKYLTFLLVVLFSVINAIGQFTPQSKKITKRFFQDADTIQNVTPALQKKRGFTDYEELTSFLNNLEADHSEYIKVSYIGESQKGREIPMVKLTNPNSNEQKIKVWLQGGLHGNEPASTEGVLYLLHELLNNPQYTYLLDKIDLAVVPMANIDGFLKQDRYAANGLDLNRDQTKLMAPESVFLKQAFSDFSPQVAVDFHEYNPFRKDFSKLGEFGIFSAFDIMFLYTGNLNVSKNLRELTDNLFVENARTVLTKNGLRHHDYMSTSDYRGEIHFNQGSNNSRSSATSYALTNTVSTLVEVRGVKLNRTSFKRRMATTFLIGMSYLKTAYNNISLVNSEIDKAQGFDEDITVTSSRSVYQDTIEVLDLDDNELMDMEVTVRDALNMSPDLVRPQPKAYLIDANQNQLISKLKTLGLKTETLIEDTGYVVEAYNISAYENSDLPYEKMTLQTVETQLETKTILFPKGTHIIYTNQKNAPMLTEVLEPEAPNSFVGFGVLETELNNQLPIYRLPKTN